MTRAARRAQIFGERDAEAVDDLLGLWLVFPDSIGHAVAAGVTAGDFPIIGSRAIAATAILDLYSAGRIVDTLTVSEYAELDPAWLHTLQNRTPALSSLPARIEHVKHIGSRIRAELSIDDYRRHGDVGRLTAELRAVAPIPAGHGFVPVAAHRSEPVYWAWEGMVPLGEATLLAGAEKIGKSLVCCELAARASRGQLVGDLAGRPVASLYLTGEDRIGHVIKPRLQLAGADLDLILVEPPETSPPVTVARIAAAVADGVRLVVLDPLVLYLDGLDDENGDLKVRAALEPFIRLAQDHHAAIIGIKHTNKSEGRAVLNRVSGSRGYTAAMRSIMFAVDDPDSTDKANPDRLLFARGNLAAGSAGHRYAIEIGTVELDSHDLRDYPRVVWKGASSRAIEEAFSSSDAGINVDERTRTDEAVDFLQTLLAGESMTANEVKRLARENQIDQKPLRTATDRLRIHRHRQGFGRGSFVQWALTADACPICAGDGRLWNGNDPLALSIDALGEP